MIQSTKNTPLVAIIGTVLAITPIPAVLAEEPNTLQSGFTVPLWPNGKMPGEGPKDGAVEKQLPSRGDNVIRLTDINEPSITIFKAPATNKPTPAVIICPGGAYGLLGIDKEGTEIAAWLNSIGITGVVLKYRVPNNMEGAFQDIQRAIRLVRHRATEWNLSPDRVGVMGFSAGGHLSARLSTNSGQATYSKLDSADDEALRPDFAILVYPAYLSQVPGRLSGNLPITPKTPPTFLVHTEDDKSFIPGSKLYQAELATAGVPNEFFLCLEGGHGYGLRSKGEVGDWPKKCQDWLVKVGIHKHQLSTGPQPY